MYENNLSPPETPFSFFQPTVNEPQVTAYNRKRVLTVTPAGLGLDVFPHHTLKCLDYTQSKQ